MAPLNYFTSLWYNAYYELGGSVSNIKNPLLSFDARGTLAKALTFVKRRGRNIAEVKPEIIDVKSPAQLSWRHMYTKCAILWRALSAAEQADWNSLGGVRHMTFVYPTTITKEPGFFIMHIKPSPMPP